MKKIVLATGNPGKLREIQSLLQPVPSAADITDNSRSLAIGEEINPEELCRWLVEHSFHNTSAV
ncbi:MAG: hypothetical protein MJA83_08820, partial [Gammaproteobacteria bacterium]|nr:hypothetical protein [Gammaproteobacteria bacterium]